MILPPELLALSVGDKRGAGGGQGLGPRHHGARAARHLCARASNDDYAKVRENYSDSAGV